jgi:thioredoxin reductase
VTRTVDVLVVGAGPAGLAVGAELGRSGVGRVEILERECDAGGIPRHSDHTGFGLRDLHRLLTGPEYARRRVELATAAGATVRTETSVTSWSGPLAVDVVSPGGLERIEAHAIVLATGARERPRAARLVPGTRPAGVFTTGELQQSVYLHGENVGRRAVIVGAEHVSFSAALTLAHGGARVAAMVTALPRHQTYAGFRIGAAARFRFPLLTGCTVVGIRGRQRVEAVEVQNGASTSRLIPCDTVVFTGDWIPDHELARRGGVSIDPGTNGPAVDPSLHTSVRGLFAAGNLIHPVETADVVALEAHRLARAVTAFLEHGVTDALTVPLRVEPPLAWISPNRAGTSSPTPPLGRFTFRTAAPLTRPHVIVEQDDRRLHESRFRRTLLPNRPCHLDAGWLARIDPAGPPVVVRLV